MERRQGKGGIGKGEWLEGYRRGGLARMGDREEEDRELVNMLR